MLVLIRVTALLIGASVWLLVATPVKHQSLTFPLSLYHGQLREPKQFWWSIISFLRGRSSTLLQNPVSSKIFKYEAANLKSESGSMKRESQSSTTSSTLETGTPLGL